MIALARYRLVTIALVTVLLLQALVPGLMPPVSRVFLDVATWPLDALRHSLADLLLPLLPWALYLGVHLAMARVMRETGLGYRFTNRQIVFLVVVPGLNVLGAYRLFTSAAADLQDALGRRGLRALVATLTTLVLAAGVAVSAAGAWLFLRPFLGPGRPDPLPFMAVGAASAVLRLSLLAVMGSALQAAARLPQTAEPLPPGDARGPGPLFWGAGLALFGLLAAAAVGVHVVLGGAEPAWLASLRSGAEVSRPFAPFAPAPATAEAGAGAGAAAPAHAAQPDPPLVVAARSGDLAEVRRRLEAGDDPNAVAPDGNSVLVEAAASRSAEVVALLLERGASPNPASPSSPTALSMAAFVDLEEIARLLLAKGADVNAPDPTTDGRTPLIQAAEGGHLALVRLFVEAGARLDATDDEGRTALHRAAEQGQVEVGRYLLERGAPLDPRDHRGATPLARALEAEQSAFAELLTARGATAPPLEPEEGDGAADEEVSPPLPEQTSEIAASLLSAPVTEHAWDGPLLPGYGGAALLELQCAPPEGGPEGQEQWAWDVGWQAVTPSRSAGLSPREEVVALLAGGQQVVAHLGPLQCVAGECHGDWVVAPLPEAAKKRVIAVAPRGFLGPGARLVVPERAAAPLQACAPIPGARLRRPSGTGCELYSLGEDEKLLVYWFERGTEDGSGFRWVFARPARAAAATPWSYVGRAFGRELLPLLAIRGDGPTRIVWEKQEGIGGPAVTTVVVTRLRADGLDVGRAFTAGGQPCD